MITLLAKVTIYDRIALTHLRTDSAPVVRARILAHHPSKLRLCLINLRSDVCHAGVLTVLPVDVPVVLLSG